MTLRTIKYDSFKRGDTPVFGYTFTAPVDGFVWTGITADFAITDVESPSNNSGAAVVRTNETLTVNSDGSASLSLQPTVEESNAFSPDTEYNVELQLKDSGGSNVATVITGLVKIVQDYII
jgi:hypothetical protein